MKIYSSAREVKKSCSKGWSCWTEKNWKRKAKMGKGEVCNKIHCGRNWCKGSWSRFDWR